MKIIIILLSVIVFSTNCLANVNNLRSTLAFDRIEAENFTSSQGSGIYHQDGACTNDTNLYRVGDNIPGNVIEYDGVDFEDGAESVTISIWGWLSSSVSGNIYMHLDSATASPFAVIAVGPTGNDCSFVSLTIFLSTFVSGIHDIYLTFSTSTAAPEGMVDIDWFQFNRLNY